METSTQSILSVSEKLILGNRLLSSMGVGKSYVLPMRVPNLSPTLDKNLASMGRGILSSIGVGVWGKAPEAFPDSNTTLDTCQSAMSNDMEAPRTSVGSI